MSVWFQSGDPLDQASFKQIECICPRCHKLAVFPVPNDADGFLHEQIEFWKLRYGALKSMIIEWEREYTSQHGPTPWRVELLEQLEHLRRMVRDREQKPPEGEEAGR